MHLHSGLYEQVVNMAVAAGLKVLGDEREAQTAPLVAVSYTHLTLPTICSV